MHFSASKKFLAIAVITVWFPNLVQSQALPPNEDILTIISREVPVYLAAGDLVLSEPSTSDSGGRKRLIYKFDISVIAKEPLFTEAREVGPFAVLIPTMEQDASLRITGVLDLTSSGKEWLSGISLDHDLTRLGMPSDRFGQPVLLSGDPSSDAKIAQLKAEVEAQAIEKMRQEIEVKLAELRSEGEGNIGAEQKRSADLILAERERGATELLNIIAEHAVKRGEVIAKQRREIAELETGLAIERQSLTRQVAAAGDVLELQSKLGGSIRQITQNDAAAMSSFAKLREQRLRFLKGLPQKWSGIVTCVDDDKPSNKTSSNLEIEFREPFSSGFRAVFLPNNSSGWREIGEITVRNDALSFPLLLDMNAPGLNGPGNFLIPDTFMLELSEDGKMRGAQPLKANSSGVNGDWTCTFNLSS